MKPPAFQFYADDFLSGTSDMTAEEVGVYIRLLCHAWNKDGLEDNERLSLLAGQCQASSLAHAKTKFRLTDGKLRNPRQEIERQKQSDYRTRQAENGRKRWLGNANPDANPDASVKPPSPSPSPSPLRCTNKQNGFPSLTEVVTNAEMIGMTKADAEQFWHHFESSGWIDKNGHPIQNWRSKQTSWKTVAKAMPLEQAHRQSESPAQSNQITLAKEYERCIFRIKQLRDGCAADAMGSKFWKPKDKEEFETLRKRRDELKKILNITI